MARPDPLRSHRRVPAAHRVAALFVMLLAALGFTLSSAAAAAPPPTLGATDWPQFQGSPAHLGSADSTALEPPLKRLWRFQEPSGRDGLSGAVVAGDLAIAEGEHGLYAVDVTTGALQWQVPRNGGLLEMTAVEIADGKELAVFTEGDKASEAEVVAVDVATQQEAWRKPLESLSQSGVTIDGDTVLLGDTEGRLYALDLATGEPKWGPRGLGAGIDAPPAAADGFVYAVTRDRDNGAVRVVALDEATGKQEWQYSPSFAAGTGTTVSVAGGEVFFGMGAELKVHALAASTGVQAWEARTRDSFSPIAGPAVSGGLLFIISTNTTDSVLYALDATDGTKKWDFQFQESAVRTSPVVVGDTAYMGVDDGRVVGLDVPSGIETWEDHTGPGRMGPIAITEDELIVSKRGGKGGLIAYGPNRGGRLLHVESPTVLKLGTNLLSYAIASVAVFVVVFGVTALRRRRLTTAADEPTPSSPSEADEPDVPSGLQETETTPPVDSRPDED